MTSTRDKLPTPVSHGACNLRILHLLTSSDVISDILLRSFSSPLGSFRQVSLVLGSQSHVDLAICGLREVLFTRDEGRKEFHCTFNPVLLLLRPRSICSMSESAAADTDREATKRYHQTKTKRASVSNFIMTQVVPGPQIRKGLSYPYSGQGCQADI